MKAMKLLLATLILATANLQAQKADKWQLLQNKKKIAAGTMETPGDAAIRDKKGMISIRFTGTGNRKEFKRTIILFDTERHELMRKEMAGSYGSVSFDTDGLRAKSKSQSFQIMTIATPADPEKAALVRLRPMLLCNVSWKQRL